MGNARTCFHVDGQTEYLRCQGYALHLVRPARCGVLWAVKTEWNHHRGSVSSAIDAFELSIEDKTTTVPRETRQSYPPAWQCSATCHKTGQAYLETQKWEVLSHPLYSPDVAPSDYHLFRSMAHGLAYQHFRSYKEVKRWIDSWIASKDASFFRDGMRQLRKRCKKVVASDGQYFEL